MMKQGIVSVGSKFHATFTAESLEKNGMLKKFYTGKKIKSKTIQDEHMDRIKLPLYMGYILRKMPFIGHIIPYNLLSDIMFDLIVSTKLGKTDFIIGFNNYVLMQMKKLKKQNTVIFLEQRIAHVNTELEIYQSEFGKIPSNLSYLMVKRKLKEYELADYILVPSKFVYQSMIQNGIAENKLLLVPYGYDSKLFHKDLCISKPEDCLRLIFVGQIGNRKGLKYLLKAVDNLKRKGVNVELVLVGGVDKDFVPLLNQYSGVYKHIEFVPQHKLLELYNTSHVFIFPSICEGSAVVTYEALGCGLPQIVTENAGSVVRDKEEGLVIPPKDVEAIERAVTYFIDNPSELKRMEENAILRATEYTWDMYGVRLVDSISNKI